MITRKTDEEILEILANVKPHECCNDYGLSCKYPDGKNCPLWSAYFKTTSEERFDEPTCISAIKDHPKRSSRPSNTNAWASDLLEKRYRGKRLKFLENLK